MNEIEQLLKTLADNDIRISVDGKDLVLQLGETELSQSLKENIRRHKQKILSYLNDNQKINNLNAPSQDYATPVFKNQKALDVRAYKNFLHIGDAYHQPVIAFFENQCHISPRSTALEFDDQTIDYLTLNKYANNIARYLSLYNVRSGDIVGIFMDRSIEMVASLLAIFKIGSVYLPIDPEYPKERILYVLEDSETKAILVHDHLEKNLPGTYATVINVDNILTRDDPYIESIDYEPMKNNNNRSDSAYIIYTSGSTGNPKGVEICHVSLTNVMIQVINELKLDKLDTFLAIASISFDISLFELIAPLMIGAKIILMDNYQCKDPAYIANSINTKNVTVLQATPAMWSLLNHYDWNTSLRDIKVISTGEALSKDLAKELLKRNNMLWNLYGPTETSIWATIKRIQGEAYINGNGTYVVIGRPLKNYTTYILDKLLQPVPVGVLGELFIGGVGLAKGYVNKQSLTKDKFVENRFGNNTLERLYKTGDLVRYLENRDIEYIGRIDNQIKINGYRIELGEIESILKQHPSIHDAVVNTIQLAKSGINMLIAYIVPQKDMPNKTGETLNKYLGQYLPNYMLPHRYMFIDEIPLSGSGKVDRKALPVPKIIGENEYVEPRDEIEKTIANIFCDILEIDKIGIYDSFFDMGGSSMLAATLLIPINDKYDLNVNLQDILSIPPTVSNVASLVKEHRSIIEELLSTDKT